MGSKQAGDLYRMLCDLEQELRSTCRTLDREEQQQIRDLIHLLQVDQSHSEKIYSTLNEILRRGGTYRNGACVLHLDIDHPDILEFVFAERHELPWVKRCVDLTSDRLV